MLYVICTSPGYQGLARTPTPEQLALDENHPGTPVMLAGPNWAMPERAFLALLEAKGFADEMRAENMARWLRMMKGFDETGKIVCGPLRQEKDILKRSGLTRADAHSKRPTPGTVEIAA